MNTERKRPGQGATYTGAKQTKCGFSSMSPRGAQAPITGGIYSRRAEWIFDGLADLELSGASCLLRAPAGGEAAAILRRLPQPLTIPVLDELVAKIRDAHAGRLFRNWSDTMAEFSNEWCEQLRVYSQGPKVNFTDHEAAVHKALVDLVIKEGGNPWKR